MKLIFVRHGDPDYENDTLTETGKVEAGLLVKRIKDLNADEYYCSPLGRAVDTAKPCMAEIGKEAIILDWLMEFPAYVFNPLLGKKSIPWDLMPSYWTTDPKFYDKTDWINTDIMKSGNVNEVYNRVIKEFDAFLEQHGYKRENNVYKVLFESTDTIVFFCHFGIQCVLLSHLLGISPLVLWQGFIAPPTSVTTVITEEREKGVAYFRCNGYGDVSHLNNAGRKPSFSGRFCEVFSNKNERH